MRYELSYYMEEDDHRGVVASFTDARSMVAYMEREYGANNGMTLWVEAAIEWYGFQDGLRRTELDTEHGTVWTFTITD